MACRSAESWKEIALMPILPNFSWRGNGERDVNLE